MFVDDTLSRAGIDLWGAAANAAAFTARARPAHRDLAAGAASTRKRSRRLEHGDAAAYRAEYSRLNARARRGRRRAGRRVAQARQQGERRRRPPFTATCPTSGDWLAAGVFAHKTAATQAGLGWIGKTGLFVSPEAGPKVRLATVFTDLDLDVGVPVTEGRCGSCHGCLDACPAGAGRDVAWQAGMTRDSLFDAAACEQHMDSLEADGTPHLRALRGRLPVRPNAFVVGQSSHRQEATMPTWRRPPEDLVDRFLSLVPDDPGVEVRRMFGCPCFFCGGNMFAGVHQENLFVRLG